MKNLINVRFYLEKKISQQSILKYTHLEKFRDICIYI